MQRGYPAPASNPSRQPQPVGTPGVTPVRTARRPARPLTYALIGAGVAIMLFVLALLAGLAGLLLVSGSGRILPGVSVAGVSLSGSSVEEAAAQLAANLAQITLRDGERSWQVPADQLGLDVDEDASAQAAQRYGRGDGSIITALIGRANVAPVLSIDRARAEAGFKALAATVDLPAANATIRMVDGELIPVSAVEGRRLDAASTLDRLLRAGGEELSAGTLDLTMNSVAPAITDATPLLEKARALLASPLTVNAYDPITNQTIPWTVPVDQWSKWLTTTNDPSGVIFALDEAALTNFLTSQIPVLGPGRFVKTGEAVKTTQSAVAAGRAESSTRVYNQPTRYTIQRGETLGTISWKFGIQMWRIQRANPGVNLEALSAGQTINMPSKDELLPLPIVPNKRIVVSISQQRMWVYENGQVRWNWPASTGIPDSPTMPGVYQVQSHEKNAYAGNWNLWMPYFMGVYEAVPGFMNGIHGFPSRGGSQILWENALGRTVTYGCILISTQNSKLLYDWAQEGVVIEIKP